MSVDKVYIATAEEMLESSDKQMKQFLAQLETWQRNAVNAIKFLQMNTNYHIRELSIFRMMEASASDGVLSESDLNEIQTMLATVRNEHSAAIEAAKLPLESASQSEAVIGSPTIQ